MNECREYARSLINNLSLLSHYVLVPTDTQTRTICRYLKNLSDKGFILDDYNMRQLINGTDILNNDPDFTTLKQLIKKIKVRTENSLPT